MLVIQPKNVALPEPGAVSVAGLSELTVESEFGEVAFSSLQNQHIIIRVAPITCNLPLPVNLTFKMAF